jgi:hypothetical protein
MPTNIRIADSRKTPSNRDVHKNAVPLYLEADTHVEGRSPKKKALSLHCRGSIKCGFKTFLGRVVEGKVHSINPKCPIPPYGHRVKEITKS